MKSALAAICLLIAVAKDLLAAEPTVAVNVDFPLPRLAANGEWTRVMLQGCTPWVCPGEPVLPFRSLRLLLPPGKRIIEVKATPLAAQTRIALDRPVEYGRLPMSSVPEAALDLLALDERPKPKIYGAALPYPSVPVELASRQRMAGYDVAIVRLYPLSYVPAASELVFVSKWSVELRVVSDPVQQTLQALADPRGTGRARVASFVENPELLTGYRSPRLLARQSVADSVDDLIITRSNLVEAFQPLVDQKIRQGLKVHVETVESISGNYAGVDMPERIRNFIRDAYVRWGVTHVLLGGDISVVPCRYAYAYMNRPEKDSLIPCDLYYACLDGSWNADGDNHWGEPTDGEGGNDVDLLAEVVVGRAPLETAAEVAAFVEKTLRYQTLGHPQPDQVLLVAEFLKEAPTGPAQGGNMFDPLLPLLANYQVSWLDDRPAKTPQWTKADLRQALDQSPHLALFNGHGNDNVLMGANLIPTRGLGLSDIAALANAWPFFAYSVGCNVGQFDNDKWSPDSIGEELVKVSERGAFAAIFNSRLGWYDPQAEWRYSGEFQLRFFEELLDRGQSNLGLANQNSKHAMLGQVETTGLMTYRWCYYAITLFGDPRLQLVTPPLSADRDTDGDGMPDDLERIAGTDPADAASVLAVRLAGSSTLQGDWRLEWPSSAGRIYSVFWAADPAGPFQLLEKQLPATPPLNTLPAGRVHDAARFYRVEAQVIP